ncbi:MAG: hypothetical protein K0A90_00285 [Methanosarcinaceae archaeon]|nr:hypothetical protein [Methanosarcinaceae archaeon]
MKYKNIERLIKWHYKYTEICKHSATDFVNRCLQGKSEIKKLETNIVYVCPPCKEMVELVD